MVIKIILTFRFILSTLSCLERHSNYVDIFVRRGLNYVTSLVVSDKILFGGGTKEASLSFVSIISG